MERSLWQRERERERRVERKVRYTDKRERKKGDKINERRE